MTPTEVLQNLASILFERANKGRDNQPLIAVRLGYGNRLKVPAGIDQGNADAGMSGGFISLWLNSVSFVCKDTNFCEVEGVEGLPQVTEVINEARITAHAQRCDSFDLLHRLKMQFCHSAFDDCRFHADIFGTPTFENIIDVTALSSSDEFEDRAEAVLVVQFRDTSIKKPECITICTQEINKQTITEQEQETLCQ